jgi:hypothetical protein
MKTVWQIESQDVKKVWALLESYRDGPIVRHRIQKNLCGVKPRVTIDDFWQATVSCMLTTQQRSGPDSAVTHFISTVPFPLSYELCAEQEDTQGFANQVITDFGGIRFGNRLSQQIAENLQQLEQGLWNQTLAILEQLRLAQTAQVEREAAEFIADRFKGFGPKQSRNLLQLLGLTRYEIPIDSRVTKWLNELGFPVALSTAALSDCRYYNFVSDGIQQLCDRSGVYPCLLDAAIFASYDRGGWSEDNAIW